MWAWLLQHITADGSWVVSLGNPSDHTTEVRLLAFGAYVFVGLSMIWLEFRGTGHINNTALATMGGVCGLGALSMRGGQ